MSKPTTLLVFSLLLTVQVSGASEPQRSISGHDFALVQAIVSVVAQKEKSFDPVKFDIVITDGGAEYFVTFEPLSWKRKGWIGSAPGDSLEVVVRKKGTVVTRWYWAPMQGR